MIKLKVRVGLFGEDDVADVMVDGCVVGRLERVPCEGFAVSTPMFVGRYSLTLTNAAADAQLHRRGFKRVVEQHPDLNTPRGKRVSSQHVSSQRAGLIAQREWTSLGVLALEAAERAHEANNGLAESYYLALARKCDASADQCPASSRNISRDVDTLKGTDR